ncbi:PAS domain S-box protein [Reyranella sp.]|uniref:PAS domain-containing hybrid sensor histidine kinase/response regulator n=1 Tax=Reyranella sp. TaxID=1929291 RepID=UPI003D0A9960
MTQPEARFAVPAFDAVDIGLVVLDQDQRVLAWNAWMESASGVGAKDAIGRRLDALFPGRITARFSSAVSHALELGASGLLTHALHSPFPLRTRSGQRLIHNLAVSPLGDPPARRCLVQFTDVTATAGREKILRERQNARYDAVVGGAPDAIMTLDSGGTIQLANPAAAQEFGYATTELVGRKLESLLRDPADWSNAFQSVLSGTPLVRPVELVAERRSGTPSYLEASASRWESDKRVFVTVILRDVNERRMAVDALRLLNRTLERRVAQSTADRTRMWTLSADVMVVASPDGTVNSINPAWSRLLGWQESSLLGASLVDFVVAEDRAHFRSELQILFAEGAPRLIEVGMRTNDGGSRRVEWSAVAGDGLLQAVGRDVTAEREAEKALAKAEEALRHSQKMEAIGQLTGGIAHDFNNILTAIIGSMEVLKRRIRAGRVDDLQGFMDGAIASANRAAALTHRLLAFARRQPLDPQAVDVNRLVRGMEELLGRTLSENVSLELALDPSAWPALTDAHQLENAILNLVINARDAMPGGGSLVITTTNEVVQERQRFGQEEVEPGSYVVIGVRDTGAGMPPDVMAKVFEPFFTTKPIGQGTGLGLSMIYGFARQSRGVVRVESAVGKGTFFRLYLPRHAGDAPSRATMPSQESAKGSGETVLVVEDDSHVRMIITDVLRELGYACLEAGDGQAALPVLTSNTSIDLLITDVGLPGLNGRQIADIARRHRPGLKILFVTGYAEHAVGDAPFLEAGMQMVTKPFALDALALKIREMLSK